MKLSFYLSDKLFVAKGVHKAVYRHPSNTRYCIKVTFTLRDTDIERELLYRKALDNIGSPVMVPLAYYFDFVAERRIAKYWNRFIDECKLHYTSFLTSDDWNSLYC